MKFNFIKSMFFLAVIVCLSAAFAYDSYAMRQNSIGDVIGTGEDVSSSGTGSTSSVFTPSDILGSGSFTDLESVFGGDDVSSLSDLLDSLTSAACGAIGLAENLEYALNASLAQVDVTSEESLTDQFTDFMTEYCGDEFSEAGEDEDFSEAGEDEDFSGDPIDGTVTVQESDCSSDWASLTPSSTMMNEELLYNIKRAAIELGMDPNQLAGVIWAESGGDPTRANYAGCPKASAMGLIQFIKSTAVGLGMHNETTCEGHQAVVGAMSISEQMDYVIKYYQGAGWEAGMSDYQAYATVHSGSPNGNSQDGVADVTTATYFEGSVLSRMEAFRCGGFDWNSMEFVEGAGAL